MINAFTSMFWREKPQRNSLCPNSLAPMPKHTFHNYAIDIRENDDDEEPNKSIWNILDLKRRENFPFKPFYSPFVNTFGKVS